VYFIGVHGVSETPVPGPGPTGNFNMGSTIFKEFGYLLGKAQTAGVTVEGAGVDYKAVSLVDLVKGKLIPFAHDNVAEGVAILKQKVSDEVANCPGKPIMLSGYSEGAWVIDQFLHDNSGLVDKISAITLFGDPEFDHTATDVIRGATNGDGAARSSGFPINPYLPKNLTFDAASWCLAQTQKNKLVHDPVCNLSLVNPKKNETVGLNDCLHLRSTCVHFHYDQAPSLLGAGADFLAKRLPKKKRLYVSTADGRVLVFDPTNTGAPVATLSTGLGANTTDPTFDPFGNLYVANFNDDSVTEFPNGQEPARLFANGLPAAPESLVFHGTSSLFVGSADGQALTELSIFTGNVVNSFTPQTEDRGVDWFDFANDGCTITYTSEGHSILRYDTCTRTQQPAVSTSLPGDAAYELHNLPDLGVLVADSQTIVRVDITGSVVQQYDAPNDDLWFAVTLDPDGRSFWAADFSTGDVVQFEIATGKQLVTFNAGAQVEGLVVH